MSRWSGPVEGKNWARKAWEAAVKEEQEEDKDDDMVERRHCVVLCGCWCAAARERVEIGT